LKNVEVTIQPGRKKLVVDPKLTALHSLRRHNIYVAADCGGEGTCGKCRIQFIAAAPEPCDQERETLSSDDLAHGFRLACMTHFTPGCEVSIPPQESREIDTILTHGEHTRYTINPAIRKVFLELPKQTIDQPVSDAELICNNLDGGEEITFEPGVLYGLENRVRNAEYRVTVTINCDRVVKVEQGDTTEGSYGVAIDLGTTTVVAALIDLTSGAVIDLAPAFNPQKIFGADVISRIKYCRESENGVAELNQILLERLEEIIRRMAKDNRLAPDAISEIVAVGNPTIQHLFLGLNPHFIGEMPYTPVVSGTVKIFQQGPFKSPAWNLPVETPPNFSGFIGSDILAGIIAQDMVNTDELQLFIDIGTNAEIVLGNRERLYVSSCAAGPAFEGAMIECGMSGVSGAIDSFGTDDGGIMFDVIGGIKPIGICGSGLIDIMATLLDSGIVDETGRFLEQKEIGPDVSDSMKKRIKYDKGNPKFFITDDVYISQRDVRNVQAAKAAIAAGINILLKKHGVDHDGISRVIIAGAFGNYVDPVSAQRIGLIPRVPLERVVSAGNTALEGAKMYLLSKDVREFAAKIPRIVQLYELATEPDFMIEYAEEMMFS
jgi:uncharacterized 2Fe-2S/4Fe-4S cluster protein (DUF4445 family)